VATNNFQLVIFTDLDGTLLDQESYSWDMAKPALHRLEERDIPWILCTSKTRIELEPLRRALGHRHPFIVENGGAILIPQGYFAFAFASGKLSDGHQTIEIGIPYSLLRTALKEIGRETGSVLKGFGDMDPKEIADRTGLSVAEAERAKTREYDEPFLILGDPPQQQSVLNQIEAKGFRWTKGGRFYHLTGENDKGRAVRTLSEIFRKKLGAILTVGLGDSLNDLPMLAAVDRAILVQKPDGSYEDAVSLPGLEQAEGIGPIGWNQSVLSLVQDYR